MYMELCPKHFKDGSEDTISSQDEERQFGSDEVRIPKSRPLELSTKPFHQNGTNKMVTFSHMSRVSEEVTEDLQNLPNNESAQVRELQNPCNGTPVVNNGYEGSPQILTLAETRL